MLYFDHIFFSVTDVKFNELLKVFERYHSVQSYEVNSKGGSWEGIYPFQEFGAFPEFLRATERNPNEQIGFAFSNIHETDLYGQVSKEHPQIEWETKEQLQGDGLEYYISTYPKEDWDRLYIWILDWQGRYIERRKSWGKVENNPFRELKEVRVGLTSKNYKILEKHANWFSNAKKANSELMSFNIPQYHGKSSSISVQNIGNDRQYFEIDIQTQNNFEFNEIELKEIETSFGNSVFTVRG